MPKLFRFGNIAYNYRIIGNSKNFNAPVQSCEMFALRIWWNAKSAMVLEAVHINFIGQLQDYFSTQHTISIWSLRDESCH